MTALPPDAVADLYKLVAELEQRLESSFAAHDAAIARQAATDAENTRLISELSVARERQNAVADILSTIAHASGDADRALYQIAETSARLFGAPSATIQIAEGDGWAKTIRVGASSKRVGAGVPQAQLKIGGRNMPGTIVGENRQVHVPDVDNVDPEIADWPGLPYVREAGTRSMSGSPLRREGKAIGALIVYRDRLAPFTDEEMALQQTFADQAAIAIENARLFNETREALERQAATAEILHTIASTPDNAGQSLQQIAETSGRLFGAPSVSIRLAENGEWTQIFGYGTTSQSVRTAVPTATVPIGGKNLPGTVVAENRQIHIRDLDHIDASMSDWPGLPHARAAGTRTMCGTPLRRQGKAIGVLIVYRDRLLPFTDDELALQQNFADQAVIAIENARLFEELQQRTNDLSESLQQQTAVGDVLKTISRSTFDLQPVLDTLVNTAALLCDAEMAFIMRREGEEYRAGAAVGFSPDFIEFLETHPLKPDRGSITGRTVLERRTIQILDVATDPEYTLRESTTLGGQHTALCVPLLREDEPIGTIVLARQRVEAFTQKQIDLVTTFANQAVIAIENTRLFDEVRQRTDDLSESLQQQTATAEVLKVISRSAFDLQTVLDALLASACRLCEADIGTIRYLDGNAFRLAATFGCKPEWIDHFSSYSTKPDRSSIFGRTIMEGHTVHVPDVLADLDYKRPNAQRLMGFRAAIGVPLLREGQAFGVVNLFRFAVGSFNEKQIELIQTFADQAVIAIENVRLFDEVQARTRDLAESLQQQTATADVLKVISRSAFDLDSVLATLVESAAKLCEAEKGVIFLRQENLYRMTTNYGFSPEFEAFAKDHPFSVDGGSTTARAAASGVAIQTVDLLADETQGELARQYQRLGGHRTNLGVPLRSKGETIGIFTLTRQVVRPFSEKQIELVSTFADQAVIAIENVRLFDEVQARTRDLAESLQQQTATADVLKVISRSAFDLQTVLDTLVESAALLCDADRACVFQKSGELFHWVSNYGFSDELIAYANAHPFAAGPGSTTSRVALEGKAIHNPDVLADPNYKASEYQRLGNYRTMLGVPLLREGAPIGVFILAREQVRPFTDRQIELVTSFADQAVIAIENVRLFDEVEAKTRDLSEALTYQTGSGNILRVIASSPTDVRPVLTAIVESACELCEADDALATLRDGDELVFQAQHGAIPVVWQRQPIDREGAAGLAVIERAPVHVHDLLAPEGEQFPRAREFARTTNVRTVLCVPLLREGESIGAIVLRRTEVRPFSDKQIALLQTFADQAVIAIGNVRLFEEVQAKTRDLSEALTYQTGSGNILSVIASSPTDVGPTLEAIVESACQLCAAYDAVVVLKDDNALRLSAHHGPIPMNQTQWANDRTSISGRAIGDRLPVHLHDVLSDEGAEFPAGQEMSRRDGCHTILGVPMLREGESIGAIVLRRTEVHPFSDKQIALLQTFADQAVIAIGNVRLFEEVQQRTRELAASLDDLRTAQDRLVQTEKLASLGQLTAGIAHEIKNPLNFVNNFAALSAELTDELNDVLKPADLAEKTREEVDELTGLLKDNLQKVVQHGQRADSIVKNMLLHSREGSGDHRPADINALIDESLNLAYHGARAEKPNFNVTLQRNFDPTAGMLEVFPQEITRVFLNLVSNGFYAVTKRKGEDSGFDPILSATTRNLGDAVEIRIRDNGTGIPPEVKDKMFNPFFTTKPAGEGTGLGLSMSHDIIVKQHGGTIDVDTEPGQFTEFRIVLPRTSNSTNNSRG